MNNWLEFISDAAPLKAVYGQDIPSLHGVDFHGIDIHRDGPRVLLRFDLPEFPSHPPKKWVAAGFNRVQLRLLAIGVNDFQMVGLQPQCRLALGMTKENGFIRLLADGPGMKIDMSVEHLLVEGVSAYRNE